MESCPFLLLLKCSSHLGHHGNEAVSILEAYLFFYWLIDRLKPNRYTVNTVVVHMICICSNKRLWFKPAPSAFYWAPQGQGALP